MIDFDFTFLQPKTIGEAIQAYKTYTDEGKKVMYFGGGTEFISRSRHGEIDVDVVIDVKQLQGLKTYEIQNDKLVIGAGVTLSTITDHVLFPLLSKVARGIATRTARNKITVGGNLCSDLPYKEAYLPFLLVDSTIIVATEAGLVERSIKELPQLKQGEFLVQIVTDKEMVKMPSTHVKRTRQSEINYPVVTLATMDVNRHLRVAISGLCDEPIRSNEMEEILNLRDDTTGKLTEEGLQTIAEKIIDDALATKEYRGFVFKILLQQVLAERKGIL